MAEEDSSTMNLDLNLGPVDNSTSDGNEGAPGSDHDVAAINLEDWLHNPRRVREVVRQQRNQRWRSLWRQLPIPQETLNLALEFIGGNAPPAREGTIASEETSTEEVLKSCKNRSGCEDEEALGKKKDSGKNNDDEGSFFDCNICLDLAREPVVTCCGHLFCWPCLYRWLHHHSDAKECPVCKGEVSMKNVTPIYGRGNSVGDPTTDSSLKVPLRPQARRVESWRQTFQRAAFTMPMEEMLRRLGSTFDLSWELAQMEAQPQPRSSEIPSEALLGRILTSRGLRRERTTNVASAVDTFNSSSPNIEARDRDRDRDSHRFSSLRLRRSNSYRATALSNFTTPAISSGPETEAPGAETLVDAYYDNGASTARISPEGEWVEDRDSLSSIAAVIQSMDTAVETDSTVSLSTSSSRRLFDASRISDVDSGESALPPPPRRRRLN